MEDLASRGAQQVFNDHLDLAQQGRVEEDITRNVSESCVVLTNRGTFRGCEGVRQLAGMLQREIPDAEYRYSNRLVNSRFAFLEWTADCGAVAVYDGADSFIIENGKIVAQITHHSLHTEFMRPESAHRSLGIVATNRSSRTKEDH
jgi:hypothetical protein